MKEQFVDLLQRSSNEIKSLRKENQLMRTRLDMFDSCMMLLTAHVRQEGGGMSPDLVWEIDKYIEAQSKQINQ